MPPAEVTDSAIGTVRHAHLRRYKIRFAAPRADGLRASRDSLQIL